jgi:hypothetical protein
VQTAVIVGSFVYDYFQCIVHWDWVKYGVEVVVTVGAALSHLQPDVYLGMGECDHSLTLLFMQK